MSAQQVVQLNAGIPTLTMSEAELIDVLRSSLYPGADIKSIKMVIGYCKASGLDPMQKPCHIVPMWDSKAGSMRDVIMPGIGLYRTQAARSSECVGVSEPEFGPDMTENIGGQTITFPAWCKVTVKRRLPTGEVAEYTAKEFWKENYAVKGGKEKSIAPNAMWTKRPFGQIAKCAEGQALRKAFPELGSQPTAEEMEGKIIDGEYTAQSETKQEPSAFELQYLPALREEALIGIDALQTAFASLPAGKEKNALWRSHGASLKQAAEEAESNLKKIEVTHDAPQKNNQHSAMEELEGMEKDLPF